MCYGRGASKGPLIAMTDDSSAERNALYSVWPDTQLLLCTFHFLQRKQTWLHDGNNRIADKDCAFLINKTKSLVYVESDSMLFHLYDEFQKCSVVNRYPNYLIICPKPVGSKKGVAIMLLKAHACERKLNKLF